MHGPVTKITKVKEGVDPSKLCSQHFHTAREQCLDFVISAVFSAHAASHSVLT